MSDIDAAIERAESKRHNVDWRETAWHDRVVLAAEVKRVWMELEIGNNNQAAETLRHREEKGSLIRQLTETEADRDEWRREARRLREELYGPNLLGPDMGKVE